MNTMVLIENAEISNTELNDLNDNKNNVIFCTTNQKNFLPDATILIIIELVQNIGYNAAYDILKYILIKVFDFFESKAKDKETKFEFNCNGKSVSFKCNFSLTDKQKDDLINVAIKKIAEE